MKIRGQVMLETYMSIENHPLYESWKSFAEVLNNSRERRTDLGNKLVPIVSNDNHEEYTEEELELIREFVGLTYYLKFIYEWMEDDDGHRKESIKKLERQIKFFTDRGIEIVPRVR